MDVAHKMAPAIELTCCMRGITDAGPDLVNIDQSASPGFIDTDKR
jgi:hypothetical protein